MPTSITTAPSLTCSALRNSGRPMAAMMMSAWRVMEPRSRVRLWVTVTVASPPGPLAMSRRAMGLPTIMLRPMTTAWAPAVSMPASMRRRWQPRGVQGTKPVGSSSASLATLTGWKPSTSLAGSMVRTISASSMCLGGGLWTRMPWMAGSALSCLTRAISSAWVVVAGSSCLTLWRPRSWHFLSLERT